VRALLDRLRPHSFQARVALAIAIALIVVFVVIQLLFISIVQERQREGVEATLHQQADSIARAVERGGIANAAATARDAGRFIGDARLVVSVDGEVVHWNEPVTDLEASADVRRGPVEVLMQRSDPDAGLFSDWGFVSLVLLALAGTGALIWVLASSVGSRLRDSVSALADSAEAVTQGRLDVRAPVTDDELGRLSLAFNRMTARLELADARQREFLADVAHELRTPVTSIEGFASALEDGTASTPEQRAESAEFIRAEAARLRSLVDDLQELTWLDLDPPVEAREIDLGELGRAAVARLALDAELKGVTLGPPEGAGRAVGDPAHVETILSNLISNAITATAEGGSVTLGIVAGPGEAGLAVTDTGRGIPPEHLPFIFDRLYRVQPGRDRRAGGSGLGLSIVRRLATLLGGRITVASRVGEGSTFTLWLPARAVAASRPRVALPQRRG
jgi:two-component system sensor histidine kinase BaeS